MTYKTLPRVPTLDGIALAERFRQEFYNPLVQERCRALDDAVENGRKYDKAAASEHLVTLVNGEWIKFAINGVTIRLSVTTDTRKPSQAYVISGGDTPELVIPDKYRLRIEGKIWERTGRPIELPTAHPLYTLDKLRVALYEEDPMPIQERTKKWVDAYKAVKQVICEQEAKRRKSPRACAETVEELDSDTVSILRTKKIADLREKAVARKIQSRSKRQPCLVGAAQD